MKKNKIKNEIYQHLIIYPIILIILSIPGTFNALYRVLKYNEDIAVMLFLQVIAESCFCMVLNIYFITSPWIKQSIVGMIKNQNKEEFDSLMPLGDLRNTRFSNDEDK